MRRLLIMLAGALALAFAAYAAFHAWIAFVPPARPVEDFVFAPPCDRIEVTGNAHKGSPLECQARLAEARHLANAPDLAVRDGDNLMLFYRGQVISGLTPSPQSDSGDRCDTLAVHKVLAVHDASSGKLEHIAQISCHAGEFERRFLVLPDGAKWRVGDASAAPDGTLIATGNNSWGDDPSQRLTLHAWPSRRVVARFPVNCRAVSWSTPSRLIATCLHDFQPETEEGDLVAFDAEVWRDQNGAWRMQATRWLKGHLEFSPAGDHEFRPAFSLRWLPAFTAAAG